jgi:hypothetical protein
VFAGKLADVKRPSRPRQDATVSPTTNSIKERIMRKTLCASVLVLVLCGSALAGDISNPPIAPGDISNPPSASQAPSNQTADGWIDTGEAAPAADGSIHGDDADSLTAAALTVLNSVLALF